MSEIALVVRQQFVTEECPNCGVVFAISADFERNRREDGRTFYCPNQHPMTFRDNLLDAERKKAIRLQQQLDQQRAATESSRREVAIKERQLRAAKGQQTKLRKRIAAGTCPECDVSFEDLAKHMAHEHPAFNPAEEDEPAEAAVEFEAAAGI